MTGADASARRDPADARWALLEPLLPAPPVRGRPRRYPLRAMIDAVRWRTRVGAPWRDVPARYGPWWRAYALYRAWQLNGVWERIEAAPVARADAEAKGASRDPVYAVERAVLTICNARRAGSRRR